MATRRKNKASEANEGNMESEPSLLPAGPSSQNRKPFAPRSPGVIICTIVAFGMAVTGVLAFVSKEEAPESLKWFWDGVFFVFREQWVIRYLIFLPACVVHVGEGIVALVILLQHWHLISLSTCLFWTISATIFGYPALGKVLRERKRVRRLMEESHTRGAL